MRVLLDTHTFLWWIIDDTHMSSRVRDIMSNSSNELFFSAASCWEIAIKANIGRITLPDKPHVFVVEQMALNMIQGLPVQISHALHVFNLPHHHRDPFDRIIIAQAQLEKLPILTSDSLISKYKVKIIW